MAIIREILRLFGEPIEQERVSILKENPEPDDFVKVFREFSEANSPQAKLDNWNNLTSQLKEILTTNTKIPTDIKKLAKESLNDINETLTSAEAMMDDYGRLGTKTKMREFKALLDSVASTIIKVYNEIYAYPMAELGKKTLTERSDGGKNKHAESEEERKERNNKLQEEINRLCLKRGMSYLCACKHLADNPSLYKKDVQKKKKKDLHFDTIRKNTKNPYTEKS